LLIAVDHEGGRVQRFRSAFTALPAAGLFGAQYRSDPRATRQLCSDAGWLMAAELRACGVDMSFAPVLDLGGEHSEVIGDRAFDVDPDVVISLARAYVEGMADVGMAAVGKHFPGHGGVGADSHVELPIDKRDLASFFINDLRPFVSLAEDGLSGMMTAHLLVPAVDDHPVSFSSVWLQDVLRNRLGYRGVVFSDDLSMHGAHGVGTPAQRAQAALAAGCDMVLVCNDRDAALEVVDSIAEDHQQAIRASRMARFRGQGVLDWPELRRHARYRRAQRSLAQLNHALELDLHDDNPA
jgi:beta-N-acetylhexosaminidase